MTLEQLEFAITQYLDGTLPPEETGALEQRLATDPQAQALLEEHKSLTALLRSQPVPELDWADVARDLSAVVTGTVGEQSRLEDQKLNTILRAASPLPEIRWDALSQRISDSIDAEVASTDAGDERFDELLRTASPMPAIHWDRLASQISNAVAAEAEREEADEAPAVIGRIGWVRAIAGLAVAACVLVATTLGLRTYQGGNTHQQPGPTGGHTQIAQHPAPAPVSGPIVQVTTPSFEESKQPAVAEISIGPSKEYARSDESYQRLAGNRSPVVIVTPVPGGDRPQQEDVEPWLGFE